MCPAVIGTIRAGTLNILIEELAHRRRCHERLKDRSRQFAIMVVGTSEVDQHIALSLIVADPLNEAASGYIGANEGLEIDYAAIFHVHGFRSRGRRDERKQERPENRRTNNFVHMPTPNEEIQAQLMGEINGVEGNATTSRSKREASRPSHALRERLCLTGQ
jgi:hypothetical protein